MVRMLEGRTRAERVARRRDSYRASRKIAALQKKIDRLITNFDEWEEYEEMIAEENNRMIRAVLRTSVWTCVVIVLVGVMPSEACRSALSKKKII